MPAPSFTAGKRSMDLNHAHTPERNAGEHMEADDVNVRRIVERVMRQRRPSSPLASQILAVADRLRDAAEWDHDEMVAQVTTRICKLVHATPRHNALTEGWLHDTVARRATPSEALVS